MSIYKKAATKRKNVRYTLSLVAYLDILGFGDLVGKISPNRISSIIRMVKEEIIPTDSFAQAAKAQHRHFSDLTVITLPNHKLQTDPYVGPPLAYIVQHLGVAQARLIDEQIVVRGSITVGEITKSWGEFFGPALIQAYNLEHKTDLTELLYQAH